VITTAALIIGTTAGTIAQSTAAYLGCHELAISEFTTALTASWVLEMLGNLIGENIPRQARYVARDMARDTGQDTHYRHH
jgi:hypothetical protein